MHSSASYTNRRTWTRILAGCGLSTLLQTTLTVAVAQQSKAPETPAQQAKRYFDGVNKQVLEMAQDFPADKYDFRLRKEMRSFGEVIVHVMSGNFYAAKTARSEKPIGTRSILRPIGRRRTSSRPFRSPSPIAPRRSKRIPSPKANPSNHGSA